MDVIPPMSESIGVDVSDRSQTTNKSWEGSFVWDRDNELGDGSAAASTAIPWWFKPGKESVIKGIAPKDLLRMIDAGADAQRVIFDLEAEVKKLQARVTELETWVDYDPDPRIVGDVHQRADGRWSVVLTCPDGKQRRLITKVWEPVQPEYQRESRERTLSARTRFLVLARDQYRCRYCGADGEGTTLHVDHVMPVIAGGTDDLDNLVTACADCNLGKSDLIALPPPTAR